MSKVTRIDELNGQTVIDVQPHGNGALARLDGEVLYTTHLRMYGMQMGLGNGKTSIGFLTPVDRDKTGKVTRHVFVEVSLQSLMNALGGILNQGDTRL